jgi:hypothetical protein
VDEEEDEEEGSSCVVEEEKDVSFVVSLALLLDGVVMVGFCPSALRMSG